MKNCISCRTEIPDEAVFCPYCGVKQERSQEKAEESDAFHEPKADSVPFPEEKQSKADPAPFPEEKQSRGLLALIGILFAMINLCYALQYFQLLLYYPLVNKRLGMFLIVVYLWNAFLLFLIAVYSRRDSGRQLLYGLWMGTALSVLLKWYVSGSMETMWNIYGGSASVFGMLLVAAGCWFLMNKHQLLQTKEEYGSAGNVIKGIPGAIRGILCSGAADKRKKTVQGSTGVLKEMTWMQRVLLEIGGSKWTLVLGIAYTENLLNQMLFYFSVSDLVGYVLSICICAGVWMIYYGCKNNTLNAGGLSMLNVIITIEVVRWMLAAAFIGITGFAAFASGGFFVGLVILVIAFLLGFYWWSMRKMTHWAYYAANGSEEKLKLSLWPIVILVITSAQRIISFIETFSLWIAANQASGSIRLLSRKIGLAILDYLEEYDLASQSGDEGVFSLMQIFSDPIVDWIQANFGLQESLSGLLFSMLIPLGAVVILIKLRSKLQ